MMGQLKAETCSPF